MKNVILCRLLLSLPLLITCQGNPSVELQAIIRGTARLPCSIKPHLPNDSALLVIWYKNDIKPIYSFDLRSKGTESGAHWMDNAELHGRSSFDTTMDPSTLSISNIQESDEAIYRCRVDYKISPTKNYKLKLSIIIPPHKPKILDDRGKDMTSIAGPYQEGSEMKLMCAVSGGKPRPWVRWLRDQNLIDSTEISSNLPNAKNNQLIIPILDRSHLHATYTCSASNNNLTAPASTKVTIEMHLKPIAVTITTQYQPLSAGREYEIECLSYGSRPSAVISWWRDGKKLLSKPDSVSEDGNVTYSKLTIHPSINSNGGSLTCRADNPHIKGGALEDVWKLDVTYVPRAKLTMGAELNPNNIVEGVDVYFECHVDSNPKAYKVVWKHNNHIIQQNQKNGIVVSHKALALQSVKKHQSGNYSCVAFNVEGDGDSNIVQLNVMYKPVCKDSKKSIVGVSRNEEAHVLCEIESFPKPHFFNWSFNNSAEVINISEERFYSSLQLSLSTLSYTPQTDMDYGTLMCWATNRAGKQPEPCIFHIIPAGKPDPPCNCSFINRTSSSMEIECTEGYDGGQSQLFQLEVYDALTDHLTLNQTSKQPSFAVNGLSPGACIKLRIYSFNAKGHSEAVVLEGITLKTAEKQTGQPMHFSITPVVAVLVAASITLVTCAFIICGAIRFRTADPIHCANGVTISKAKIAARASLFETEDANPDVIPCNKESDYQLVYRGNTKEDLIEKAKERNPSIYVSLQLKKTNGNFQNGDMYKGSHIRMDDNFAIDASRISRSSSDLKIKLPTDRSLTFCPSSDDGPLGLSPTSGLAQREVISIRTPLMANQQESCV